MFIKIINNTRKQPRIRRDLNRLLIYLFTPKDQEDNSPLGSRLLGPPLFFNLITSKRPWGDSAEDAARELSRQIHQYAKAACYGMDFPDVWYTHIVLSLHPRDATRVENPQDLLSNRNPYRSRYKNTLRICIDILKTLGISFTQPIIVVPHADRRHIHVHIVLALPVKGMLDLSESDCKSELRNQARRDGSPYHLLSLPRSQIWEIALIGTNTFGLTPPSKKVLSRNPEILKLWEDLEYRTSLL